MDLRWIVDHLEKGQPLYASIPSTDSGHLAWVAVRPMVETNPADSVRISPYLRKHGFRQPPFPRFAVQAFELPKNIEVGWDSDICEVNRRDLFASSVDEVAKLLESLGTSLDKLDQPWKCAFPV